MVIDLPTIKRVVNWNIFLSYPKSVLKKFRTLYVRVCCCIRFEFSKRKHVFRPTLGTPEVFWKFFKQTQSKEMQSLTDEHFDIRRLRHSKVRGCLETNFSNLITAWLNLKNFLPEVQAGVYLCTLKPKFCTLAPEQPCTYWKLYGEVFCLFYNFWFSLGFSKTGYIAKAGKRSK